MHSTAFCQAFRQWFGVPALVYRLVFHVERKETDTCPYLFLPLPHLCF